MSVQYGLLKLYGDSAHTEGPNEERVRAVVEAREPQNASEIQSFLGLVNYSSRFIP